MGLAAGSENKLRHGKTVVTFERVNVIGLKFKVGDSCEILSSQYEREGLNPGDIIKIGAVHPTWIHPYQTEGGAVFKQCQLKLVDEKQQPSERAEHGDGND
jgi:hypothetical protein